MYGKVKHVRQAGRQKDTGIWDGGGLEAPEWWRRRRGGGIGRGRMCVKITKHIEIIEIEKLFNVLRTLQMHCQNTTALKQLGFEIAVLAFFVQRPTRHVSVPYCYNIGHRMEGR